MKNKEIEGRCPNCNDETYPEGMWDCPICGERFTVSELGVSLLRSKKEVDISDIDFKYYKPLEESLKQSAGKNNYFVPKGIKEKEQWEKNKKEQYIKNVKKDLDKGVFEEAINQKKLTLNQVFKIIKSIGN